MTEITISPEELSNYQLSTFAKQQPEISEEIYALMKDDIDTNGQQIPVVIYGQEVFDGRHRFKIALELKKPLKAIVVERQEEAERLADSGNEFRRHISKSQYAMRAVYAIQDAKDNHNKKLKIADTSEIRNKLVSVRLVKNAKKIADNNPDLAQEVYDGKKTVEEALKEHNTASNSPNARERIIASYKEFLESSLDEDAVAEFEELSSRVKLGRMEMARDYVYVKRNLLRELEQLNNKLPSDDRIDIEVIKRSLEPSLEITQSEDEEASE